MIRLDERRGAIAAIVVGALYMGTALATGHSARSEPRLDLRPGGSESGLDVWKASALMLAGNAAVVDVRPAEEYARFDMFDQGNHISRPGMASIDNPVRMLA